MDYNKFLQAVIKQDYFHDKRVDGIDYYVPNDEEEFVMAVDHINQAVAETGFYETDDFCDNSEYNFYFDEQLDELKCHLD